MMDILRNLHIYTIKVNCEVISPITFPNFPGIALRGGFGLALKNSVCIMKQHKYCKECPLATMCVYAIIFETPNVKPSEKMSQSEYIPHPFSLAPLFDYPAHFKEGDTFSFKFSLFGDAFKYFPNVLHAFIQLGDNGIGIKRGRFTIKSIQDYASNATIYDGETIQLSDLKAIQFYNTEYTHDTLEISFLTPCKIKSNGKYQKYVDLETIIKNIKRKIEIITYFFENNPIIIDISNINFNSIHCVSQDIKMEYVKRYSKRRNQKMSLGGYKGKAVFSGNVQSVYSFLKIGEFINIGSNTSFGFGAIQVV
ncbi:MAG: CRISPR system precrRNA processing endoribonuclease RAMP protein Cas6 [Spirochaetota bacterium]